MVLESVYVFYVLTSVFFVYEGFYLHAVALGFGYGIIVCTITENFLFTVFQLNLLCMY